VTDQAAPRLIPEHRLPRRLARPPNEGLLREGAMTKEKKDINESNREFWETENRKFLDRVQKRPHDLQHAVQKTHERIEDGAFKKVKSLEAQMAELDALRRADQSVRASTTRKRKREHGQIVTEAMRLARRDGQDLQSFLDAAANGSISGIERIVAPGPRDGGKYLISCDELSEDAKFSLKTIGGWWTKAADHKS
jgi:hypothetical protein